MESWDQNRWDSVWSQGGQVTNLDLQKHMAFHIRYMALTFRQVNCPAICPPWDSWSALTFRCPNMEVLGGVSSTSILQLPKKSPNPWRHHGNFHNPLPWYYVAGEYCSYVLEYFQVPTWQFKWVFPPRGHSGQWSLQLAFTAWPLDMSLWPFLFIGV